MIEILQSNPQIRIEHICDDIRSRLNKRLPPDVTQITTLLTHWINQTELKWDSEADDTRQYQSGRMFYEDRIFRHDTMFRFRRIRNEGSLRRELVLARVSIVKTERGKGYFTQLLTKLEEIAQAIEADLSVECASKRVSSILLNRGYLRQSHVGPRHVQLANALEGSWIWHRNDETFKHKLVTVPNALLAQLKQLSSLSEKESARVIQQELDCAFARISSRLEAEVKPVSEIKHREYIASLQKIRGGRKTT